ncbi:alpha/beta hydrolase [Kribbella sp. NPDC051770]|uniref:alpha/beta fold hydrolase n=1 Tax=Kribbella sp. NPDC051770 TaxID=3155413 RepID=UPI00342FFA21
MLVELADGIRLQTWTSGTPGSAATGSAAPQVGASDSRAPVLLLHGGPGLWDYLEPVAALIDDRVVHRYDQRGCGGSDPSDEQTIARTVADLEELRAHWGHERIVVLGHSFGATLALRYAAAHPARVAHLIYLSGVGVGDWRTPSQAEARRRMTDVQADRLESLGNRRDRNPDEEREFRALSWFTDHADRERAWAWALEDADVPHPINFAANRALSADNRAWGDDRLLQQAAALTMPVDFIHGEGDPRPASAVRELANATGRADLPSRADPPSRVDPPSRAGALAPTVRFHLVEGAGHSPWRERPEEFRLLLNGILSEPDHRRST